MHPIARYRLAKGWTQRDLGERVGASTTSVSEWENGAKPRPRYIAKLAEALGVDGLELVNQIDAWPVAGANNQEG
jgi:transcriptional regulator with XRE-family HTH domain